MRLNVRPGIDCVSLRPGNDGVTEIGFNVRLISRQWRQFALSLHAARSFTEIASAWCSAVRAASVRFRRPPRSSSALVTLPHLVGPPDGQPRAGLFI